MTPDAMTLGEAVDAVRALLDQVESGPSRSTSSESVLCPLVSVKATKRVRAALPTLRAAAEREAALVEEVAIAKKIDRANVEALRSELERVTAERDALFKAGLHFWSNADCAPSCASILSAIEAECDCGHDDLELTMRETGLPLTLAPSAPTEGSR